jgi:hypothetical protein
MDELYQAMLASVYLMITSFCLLIAYACLSSLYWSLVACLERLRDYLGKVNKS